MTHLHGTFLPSFVCPIILICLVQSPYLVYLNILSSTVLLLDKLNPKHWQDETRWLEGITDSIDMSLSKLQSWWWIGKPGMLQCMGVKRVRHDWTTKLKLKLRNQRSYCQNPLDHRKSKRVSEKRLLYWLCQSLWLCGSLQTVENSWRDGNNRPPSREKPVCGSRSNS